MSERPILFSSAMVRAILEGRKTKTRRVLRPQPHEKLADTVHYDRATGGAMWASFHGDHGVFCPYGIPGDRLWVRETWRADDYVPEDTIYLADAAAELEAIERELEAQAGLAAIGEENVRQALRTLAVDLATGHSVPQVRDQLLQLLERVELDPEDPAEVVLRYRLPAFCGAAGVSVASPQRSEQYPGAIERRAKLAA